MVENIVGKGEKALSHFLKSLSIQASFQRRLSFFAGPRMCLGDSMAKTEVFLIFSNLVKSFTFTKSDAADLDDAAAVREGQVIFSADTFEIDIHGRN